MYLEIALLLELALFIESNVIKVGYEVVLPLKVALLLKAND